MKVYTKAGDGGMTSLMNGVRVSKSDDRVELLGTIDELNSHIGLAKAAADEKTKEKLSGIQQELINIMAGIAAPREAKYKVQEEQVEALEQEIDRMEDSFAREKKFVLYGGCELSARLDVARAVARRAERCFRKVSLRYGADKNALCYVNRLSDYLYISARYADYRELAPDKSKEQEIGPKEMEDIVRAVLEKILGNMP